MIEINFAKESLEMFFMIMVRLAAFIYTAPFYSMKEIPNRIKVGLTVVVSVLLVQVLPHTAIEYSTSLEYAAIVIKEAAVGCLLGFSTNICTFIINFAGRIMDIEMGFSMVNIMDPASKEQSSATGTFYSGLLMLILMITGMHHYILKAFVDSYALVPIQGAVFNITHLYHAMTTFLSDYIVIGFRICLPMMMATLMLNVILGILAKIASQMNMFVVGLQLKVLAGLAVLLLTIALFPSVSDFIYAEMKKMFLLFLEGMY